MALYPKELLELLEEYLSDGVITMQERNVLRRKAEKMGVDAEEFDLYFTAQEQKEQKKSKAAVSKRKGRTCPHCGSPIPQLIDCCPECGQTISPEATAELNEIIENLEDALVSLKSDEDFSKSKAKVERYLRKAELYYSSNPKIQKLISAVKAEFAAAEKEKAKQNTFRKKHPYIFSFLILLACSFILAILALIIIPDGEAKWLVAACCCVTVPFIGGCIIAMIHDDAEEKSENNRRK